MSFKNRRGSATNDSAAAGAIGEYISSTWNTTSTTGGAWQDMTSISLTAGDWDVSMMTYSGRGSGGTLSLTQIGISATSGNSAAGLTEGDNRAFRLIAAADVGGSTVQTVSIPTFRVSLSATTTYYAKLRCDGSGDNAGVIGRISARRAR